MKKITSMQAQWKAESKCGESLVFEKCKGGYFSMDDEYGLKAVGKTEQKDIPSHQLPVDINCVKQGTKITVSGKNLFDNNAIEPITILNSSGTSADRNGVIMNIAAGIYTISAGAVINGSYIFCRVYHSETDYSTYYIVTDSKKFTNTITVNEGEQIIIFDGIGSNNLAKSKEIITNSFIQLEKNGTATSYEPYAQVQEIIVPCDLYEGDIWYPMSGKVERHMRAINELQADDLYLAMNNHVSFNYTIAYTNTEYQAASSNKIWCNTFPNSMQLYGEWQRLNSQEDVSIFSEVTNIYFSLPYSNLGEGYSKESTKADLIAAANAFLQTMDITVVYELETPILEEYESSPCYTKAGTAKVTQEAIGLSAELRATMLTRR